MDKDKQLAALKQGFDELADLFVALGDETRQHLIMTLFDLPCKQQGGARVGEITAKTHLSRPAVSHHLKILRLAGVVGMRWDFPNNADFEAATRQIYQQGGYVMSVWLYQGVSSRWLCFWCHW